MALDFLRDFFFPWPLDCVLCGEPTAPRDILCPACVRGMGESPVNLLLPENEPFDGWAAAYRYATPAGERVRALKYRSVTRLSERMASDMVRAAVYARMEIPDQVTFVPMHWLRRRAKGWNQSELLAKHVANQYGLKAEPLLRRTRMCRQQASLSDDAARAANVEGAFRASGRLDGSRVMLIDDVYTTGATARACARALLEAGAGSVSVLVYAYAGRK